MKKLTSHMLLPECLNYKAQQHAQVKTSLSGLDSHPEIHLFQCVYGALEGAFGGQRATFRSYLHHEFQDQVEVLTLDS